MSKIVYTRETTTDDIGTVETFYEKELQDKTITENGQYTADEGYEGFNQVTVNVAGEQPALYAPTISFDNKTTVLTITNDTRNGSFVSNYEVYSNDSLAFSTTENSIVLINNIPFTGTRTIQVKAVGTNFIGATSNEVVWQLLAPTIELIEKTLTITDENNVNIVAGYNLYINDSLITTTLSQTIDLSTYGIADGDTIKVCAISNIGTVSAFSNIVMYETISGTFGANSWSAIANAIKTNTMPETWVVGDTKSVTLTNGETFTIRLCDLKADRYAYTDGTGNSKAVFEFVELQTTTHKINEELSNIGGWAESNVMRSTVMPELYALLPSELQSVISEVNVLSGIGNQTSSGTSTSANKLFLPALCEIYTSTSGLSIGIAESPKGIFDYYETNSSAEARVKYFVNTETADTWFTRSPYIYDKFRFCTITNTGGASNTYAGVAEGVALIFAI